MALQNLWSSFPAAVPAMLLLAAAGLALSLVKKKKSTPTTISSPPSCATASTPPLRDADHEVFLSFRGPDVRTNFADFLYEFLRNSKIRTFLDEEGIRKGAEIEESLFNAIKESKVYIPIISRDYASSTWCLRELAYMVKICNQGNGSIILPIFYMVEPRDVRHHNDSYAKAFRRHSENKKYGPQTIQEWKDALLAVGELKGWHVTPSHRQGAIAREVFSCVRSHLMKDYLLVREKLVGIKYHVEQVTKLLNQGVKVIGIIGMGGLGKTTMAMAVRDEVYKQFDYCFFLRDVRETLLNNGGIVALQRQIISAIPGQDGNVQDESQGIQVIKDRVSERKTLIVVDDADEGFKFEKIFGRLEDFSPESRFIITTRNKRVLQLFRDKLLYEPDELGFEHSRQLFSLHAFGLDNPPEGWVDLSDQFVKAATCLPLAIKVIGATLYDREEWFWEAKLEQLRKIPQGEVQKRLMISYEDLSREEKQIFLDIACHFIGLEKEKPFYMWRDCDYFPEIGVDALILKSLVKINEENEFWMHDSIRDLGRAIVREEDPQFPWRCSRIWSDQDAQKMIAYDGEASERLEVFSVKMEKDVKLADTFFHKSSSLRHLKVFYGEFEGNFESILPNLRCLELSHCRSLPIDISLKRLVIIRLHHCGVTDNWRGWGKIKAARNLKAIDVQDCWNIRKSPDLSGCINLELLNFTWVHAMSGKLQIGNLKSLKYLKVDGSKKIELIGDIRGLRNLQEIHMTSLELIPSGIGGLPALQVLKIRRSKFNHVPELPTSLRRLYLVTLYIPNLVELTNLETLYLRDYEHSLPADIWKLSKLKSLVLSSFRHESLLMEDDGLLPSSLEKLQICDCIPLERLPSLANLVNLTHLLLNNTGIKEIRGLAGLRNLERFEIRSATKLMNLQGLEQLSLVKELILRDCHSLEKLKLPCLLSLTKLQRLEIMSCPLLAEFSVLLSSTLEVLQIQDCTSLGELPNLCGLKNMESLQILGCVNLTTTELIGVDEMEALQQLNIRDCSSLEKFPDLAGFKHLQILEISRCKLLTEVTGLERLESLRTLQISHCPLIENLPDFSGLKDLRLLYVLGCTRLTQVTGIENLAELGFLTIDERINIPTLVSQVRIDRRS